MTFLTAQEEQELRALHRKERDRNICDRIKAVLLSNQGWDYITIAKALMLDEKTVSTYVFDYKTKKKLKHESGGSKGKLTHAQSLELSTFLEVNLHTKIQEICCHVEQTYSVKYTVAGMRSWMSRNDFVYKKPKGFPAKANEKDQAKFIEHYDILMKTTPEDEPILFGDSVHPTQATVLSYGWIRRGKEHHVPTTGMRTRINITGAINLEKMDIFTREFDKVNGSSFVNFLKFLEEECYPKAPKIHFIVDRGSCHTSKEVKAYLAGKTRVQLHYLPTYSPNLNPIERLWKVMHEHVTYNKFYEKKEEFISAVLGFFNKTVGDIKDLLLSRINDNFAHLKQ